MNLNKNEIITIDNKDYLVLETLDKEEKHYIYLCQIDQNFQILPNIKIGYVEDTQFCDIPTEKEFEAIKREFLKMFINDNLKNNNEEC